MPDATTKFSGIQPAKFDRASKFLQNPLAGLFDLSLFRNAAEKATSIEPSIHTPRTKHDVSNLFRFDFVIQQETLSQRLF
jgi:hypothetical protein